MTRTLARRAIRTWKRVASSCAVPRALVLGLLVASSAGAQVPASERQALIDLYNSTNGPGWGNNTNWLGAAGTECTWHGVICDPTRTTVYRLMLNVNNLAGLIPATIGNFASMGEIDLQANQLTGPIPAELGNLSQLTDLELYWNRLTGSIPPELGKLANLRVLHLIGNQLSGPIPPELGNLGPLMYDINLSENRLSGSIPAELSRLTSLVGLELDQNQLTGPIPPELGNMTNLQGLTLRANHLTGSIPPELGHLHNLVGLALESNELTGPIPPELGEMVNLRDLILWGNQLSGSIPAEFGSLAGLQNVNLSYNHLLGPIPSTIGGLASLSSLDMSYNNLSGAIPGEFGNLTRLQWLFLDSNQLVGPLPGSFVNLTSLAAGGTALEFNGLYSSDPAVVAFVNQKQNGGDWQSLQTVAPTDLKVGEAKPHSLTATWDAITYQDPGQYLVYVASQTGGPYTLVGGTTDKTVTSMVVGGLSASTMYYVVVQSVTYPDSHNQNTVVSDYSVEVAGSTTAAQAPQVRRRVGRGSH